MKRKSKKFRKIPMLQNLFEINEDGTILRRVSDKMVFSQQIGSYGYYKSRMTIDGVRLTKPIHVLVADAWIGKRPEGMEIDHIDQNRQNNHYTNLRYVSQSENDKNRNMHWSVGVTLIDGKKKHEFPTKAAAAQYLHEQLGNTVKAYLSRLARKQTKIGRYSVTYHPREKPKQLASEKWGRFARRESFRNYLAWSLI